MPKDAGATTVAKGRLKTDDFATDHVFEVQSISKFLEWLCQGKQLQYAGSGTIQWPSGWQQPDTVWCRAVFGSIHDGFRFPLGPNDADPGNFIEACATELGHGETSAAQALLALYYEVTNGFKTIWLGARDPSHTDGMSDEAAVKHVSEVSFSHGER